MCDYYCLGVIFFCAQIVFLPVLEVSVEQKDETISLYMRSEYHQSVRDTVVGQV